MDRNIKQLIAIADGKHAQWLKLANTPEPEGSYARVQYSMAYDKALFAKIDADKALRDALEPIEIGSCPPMNKTNGVTCQGD